MTKLFPTHPFPAPPTPPSVVIKPPSKTPLFPTKPFTGTKPPAVIKQEKIDKAKKDAAAKAAAAAAGGGGGSTTATSATTAAGGGWGKVGAPTAYQNSAFDKRIASQNPWFPAITSRGSIVQNREWLKASGLTNQKYPFKLQFLYNPSELNYGYGYDPSVEMPAEMTAYQSATPLLGGEGLTTLSVQLLFDRTYDVLDGKIPTGCLDDVTAFQQLVGITGGQGNLMYIPMDVYFGAAVDVTKFIVDAHNYPRPISTLHFHGVITGASVTYTHFTHDMTPVRAVISMDMKELITDAEIWKNAHPGASAATDPANPANPAAPKPGDNTPKDAAAVKSLDAQIKTLEAKIATGVFDSSDEAKLKDLKKKREAAAATPASIAAKAAAKKAADAKKKADAARKDAARRRRAGVPSSGDTTTGGGP